MEKLCSILTIRLFVVAIMITITFMSDNVEAAVSSSPSSKTSPAFAFGTLLQRSGRHHRHHHRPSNIYILRLNNNDDDDEVPIGRTLADVLANIDMLGTTTTVSQSSSEDDDNMNKNNNENKNNQEDNVDVTTSLTPADSTAKILQKQYSQAEIEAHLQQHQQKQNEQQRNPSATTREVVVDDDNDDDDSPWLDEASYMEALHQLHPDGSLSTLSLSISLQNNQIPKKTGYAELMEDWIRQETESSSSSSTTSTTTSTSSTTTSTSPSSTDPEPTIQDALKVWQNTILQQKQLQQQEKLLQQEALHRAVMAEEQAFFQQSKVFQESLHNNNNNNNNSINSNNNITMQRTSPTDADADADAADIVDQATLERRGQAYRQEQTYWLNKLYDEINKWEEEQASLLSSSSSSSSSSAAAAQQQQQQQSQQQKTFCSQCGCFMTQTEAQETMERALKRQQRQRRQQQQKQRQQQQHKQQQVDDFLDDIELDVDIICRSCQAENLGREYNVQEAKEWAALYQGGRRSFAFRHKNQFTNNTNTYSSEPVPYSRKNYPPLRGKNDPQSSSSASSSSSTAPTAPRQDTTSSDVASTTNISNNNNISNKNNNNMTPENMRVAELRSTLSGLGVQSKILRQMKKAELVNLLRDMQDKQKQGSVEE